MAYERVSRGVTARDLTLVVTGVYLIAVVAWLAMLGRWLPMPGASGSMAMDMSSPGVPEAMATASGLEGALLYLAMWSVMMIAMMYPSSVPLVRLYHRTLEGISPRAKALRVSAFLGAYTLVWAATGVIPLVVNRIVPIAAIADSKILFAGALVGLGVYQLSPYKDRCLDHCRSPLGFLMTHQRSGARGAARMGFDHGAFCLGCCWALFAFMVVVGTMNLVWMAGITVVLSLERTVSWGGQLSKGVGIASLVAGLVLVVSLVP